MNGRRALMAAVAAAVPLAALHARETRAKGAELERVPITTDVRVRADRIIE